MIHNPESDPRGPVWGAAEMLISGAVYHGYLPHRANSIGSNAMHHVRTEMLVLVLNEMEEFDWRKESKGKVDWWFGTVFGHLVRLAYFELGYIDKNYWQRLLRLFRHYFGSEIDAYFPAIFLAAATSGGSARDEGLIGEARRILDVLEAGDSPFLTHGTID